MHSAEPVHGTHCNSRTWPTRCKYCGAAIFFFTCDHGSKVLFNSLGQPWPRHSCTEYYIAQYGKEKLEQYLKSRMMTPEDMNDFIVEQDYEVRIQKARREKPKQPTKIQLEAMRQDPYDGLRVEEWGIVQNILHDLNLYKKFKLENTTMGTALLGPFAKGKFSQVTIHSGALGDEDNASFTFLVTDQMLKRLGLIAGDLIFCKLRGKSVAGNPPVWICEHVEMG